MSGSTNSLVTGKRIEKGSELKNNTVYYWKVKAVDASGQSSIWGKAAGGITARFKVDLEYNKRHNQFVRIPIRSITSTGRNHEKIINLGDEVKNQWVGEDNLQKQWIQLDLGKKQNIGRIWLFSDSVSTEGRLKDFVWEYSNNGKDWISIGETRVTNSDSFRRIQSISPIYSQYFRLIISKWIGNNPRICEISLYGLENPPILETPNGNYVLIVGNSYDGTEGDKTKPIVSSIERSGLNLKSITIPYYEIRPETINTLEHPPIAIIFSGLGRAYAALPMFEFNGEYAIIRNEKDIPILGICGGHQLLAMAFGHTFTRDMGVGYDTPLLKDIIGEKAPPPVKILKEESIFYGMPTTFCAPEFHSWEIAFLPDMYETIGDSNCIEVIKRKGELVYGTQFHPEKDFSFNVSSIIFMNFLRMALRHSNENLISCREDNK